LIVSCAAARGALSCLSRWGRSPDALPFLQAVPALIAEINVSNQTENYFVYYTLIVRYLTVRDRPKPCAGGLAPVVSERIFRRTHGRWISNLRANT
jgi:hypothetical protein